MADCFLLQGCVHGDIKRCYESALELARKCQATVSAIIWAGDVQTMRDESDLTALACPWKYRSMKDFRFYYDCETIAPYFTLFVGGNHEASKFLNQLWFGGWVAPNIWYMGKSGYLKINGNRVVGLSGIFKGKDYARGYYESEPFTESTMRSVYHVRRPDIQKLESIRSPIDVCVSHDWPAGVIQENKDRQRLCSAKTFLREDLNKGELGNPHLMGVLNTIHPKLWVAAHYHVNFTCEYRSPDSIATRFVAHDKPKRNVSSSLWNCERSELHFLPSQPIPRDDDSGRRNHGGQRITVTAEWLLILSRSTPKLPYGFGTTDTDLGLDAPYTMEELKALAASVKSATGTCWEEWLRGDTVSPELLDKLEVEIPNWDTLDYRDPESQSRWWLRLIGVSEDNLPTERLRNISNVNTRLQMDQPEYSVPEPARTSSYFNPLCDPPVDNPEEESLTL